MKKTAISILLALLTFTALAQTSLTDTYWRNDATGDWLIGFAPRHVIYAGKVWEITSLTEKNDAYTLTLDNGTTVKVGRMKNGTRAITFGKTKPLVCSKITGEALPDYPIKDARQGFVDNGYRTTDSVTIVGWLKDMPEELWKEHGRDFTAILWNICTYDQETFSAPMDSLGRFTLRMPLLNTSTVLLDWYRTYRSTPLEPGKTYFFLSDHKTGQMLWMGDDVRVQNELLAYSCENPHCLPDWSERGKIDATLYRHRTDSAYTASMANFEEVTTLHPNLSQRYRDYVKGLYLTVQGDDMMRGDYFVPDGKLPEDYINYVTKKIWQKMPQPYTLHFDFSTFMHSYLGYLEQSHTFSVYYDTYKYKVEMCLNEEELALLDRWNTISDDFTAQLSTVPEEEWPKLEEKIYSENAEIRSQVEALLSSPKVTRVMDAKILIQLMPQKLKILDSIGADPIIKDIWLADQVCSEIDRKRVSLHHEAIDTLKALSVYSFGVEIAERLNDKYLALENREFDKLVLRPSVDLKDMSEGEALLRKILEPYRGKFVLLDIWGTWCAPCKQLLSRSTEEYARLKDYDLQYLYLANKSPMDSWENVIKEYNVSGPNVAHYNLPPDQQSAIEHYLKVSGYPTYKLFDRNGNLIDINIDLYNIENVANLLEQMK